jgi:predicted CopG family antitoxin
VIRKHIVIDEKTYNMLKEHRSGNETFDMIIKRLCEWDKALSKAEIVYKAA